MKALFLAALTALALPASALAQESTTAMTVSGTVVSAGNDALVIETATGRMTFQLDSALDRMRYNNLTPGTQVTVTHRLDSQGTTHIATAIDVGADSPPASRATSGGTNTYGASDDRYAADDRLPGTASPAALVALLGVAALLGGWMIHNRKNHLSSPTSSRRPNP